MKNKIGSTIAEITVISVRVSIAAKSDGAVEKYAISIFLKSFINWSDDTHGVPVAAAANGEPFVVMSPKGELC